MPAASKGMTWGEVGRVYGGADAALDALREGVEGAGEGALVCVEVESMVAIAPAAPGRGKLSVPNSLRALPTQALVPESYKHSLPSDRELKVER